MYYKNPKCQRKSEKPRLARVFGFGFRKKFSKILDLKSKKPAEVSHSSGYHTDDPRLQTKKEASADSNEGSAEALSVYITKLAIDPVTSENAMTKARYSRICFTLTRFSMRPGAQT